MSKYLTILKIAWQNEFTYRLNFVLWRFRVVLRIFMTYFLWRGVLTGQGQLYGYTESQILVYLFLVFIVTALVMSAPASERIGEDIATGNLSNYLVKPVNYLKVTLAGDLASKLLNLSFAFVEITVLFLIIKPHFNFQLQLSHFLAFILLTILAMFIYFFLTILARSVAFWTPEDTWSIAFMLYIMAEVLSGAIFPVDILPAPLQIGLQLTPFPYLIYYPIAAFVGKLHGLELVRIIIQSGVWLLILQQLAQFGWRRGLKSYAAEGR